MDAASSEHGTTPGDLPKWSSVLAVVAHPDDESFGLGAVLSGFVDQGAAVSVLCFTRGEASTLHGVTGDLSTVRAGEFEAAGHVLGIGSTRLRDYPDGGLADTDTDKLVTETEEFARLVTADGLVAFDTGGVTGHSDHRRATLAAVKAAERLRLGVLGWTIPTDVAAQLNAEFGSRFGGHDLATIDLVIPVDRTVQNRAVACHPSQAVAGSVLWRRLELLGSRESLRWLTADPVTSR